MKDRVNIGPEMDHIKLLITFINLIVGVLVVSHVFQVYRKYSYAYLKSLTGYIIFFNLFILSLIISKYLEINVSEEIFRKYSFKPDDIFLIIAIIVDIGLVYSIIQIGLRLFNHEIPKKVTRWLFPVFILIFISYIIRFIVGEELLFSKILYFIYNYFYDNFIIVELVELIALPFLARHFTNKSRKSMVISFSILYLSRYLFFLIMFFLIPNKNILPHIVLLYFNLIPLFG